MRRNVHVHRYVIEVEWYHKLPVVWACECGHRRYGNR